MKYLIGIIIGFVIATIGPSNIATAGGKFLTNTQDIIKETVK